MNRLTKPRAQMLFGIARKPARPGRLSGDLAVFIGVVFGAGYASNTMADTGRAVLVIR